MPDSQPDSQPESQPDPEPDSQARPGPGPERSPFGAPASADEVGLQRLRQALFRPSRGQLIVGVLLAVLGFAAITQVRTNTTDNSYAGYREQDLVDVLSGLADQSQRSQTEISRLDATRRRLQQNRQDQSAAVAAAQKQADELSILAGWVPVTGPGIRMTVTEGPRDVPSSDEHSPDCECVNRKWRPGRAVLWSCDHRLAPFGGLGRAGSGGC